MLALEAAFLLSPTTSYLSREGWMAKEGDEQPLGDVRLAELV